MSHALSLKLNDDIYCEAEKVIKEIKKPRNAFINEAVRFYTRAMNRKLLKAQYAKESALTAKQSLSMSRELSEIEDEILGL